jgi:hypothetical protein
MSFHSPFLPLSPSPKGKIVASKPHFDLNSTGRVWFRQTNPRQYSLELHLILTDQDDESNTKDVSWFTESTSTLSLHPRRSHQRYPFICGAHPYVIHSFSGSVPQGEADGKHEGVTPTLPLHPRDHTSAIPSILRVKDVTIVKEPHQRHPFNPFVVHPTRLLVLSWSPKAADQRRPVPSYGIREDETWWRST